MELVTLDANLQPDKLIENYQSLIWTERYSKAGDFEIKSSDISYLRSVLPIETPTTNPTYVSLRESTVPMIVETHKIEKKIGAAPIITITGRSFEACALERRVSVRDAPPAAKTTWIINAAKESDAAYEAMRTVLGDTTRYLNGTQILPALSPVVAEDAISQIDLTLPADYGIVGWNATYTYGPNEVVAYGGTFYVSANITGNLNKTPNSNPTYWTALSTPAAWSSTTTYAPRTLVIYSSTLYISSSLSGNLNKQPDTNPTYWSTVASSNMYEIKADVLYNTVMDLVTTNGHGIKSVRPSQNGTKFGVEIYNGADLTGTVVFDARFDQFDGSTYLLSMQGSTNVAYVYRGAVSGVSGSTAGSDKVLKNTGAEPTGLARRVLLLDLTSDNTVVSSDVSKTRGLIELYKNNATALFDGEIAQQVAAGYNKTYFLGDLLKLQGEYGLYQNVRVAEFIRSSDNQGTKAYPTFEAVVP